MDDFIEVPAENILKESHTTISRYGNKKYVIYLSLENLGRKIRVNTYYSQNGGKIKLCRYYDRGLCDTMEEYEALDLNDIERQAYGSWMDGAR